MKADKMIFGDGEDVVYSTDSNETGLNNNVIVCASSGSGKTMSVIEPRLINTFNSSLVVTVAKRRIVEKYSNVFRQRGYNVFDLNFTNPLKSNIAYDPLEYISSYSDITFLAESIVKSNLRNENTSADPYWNEASCSLMSALISYVLMTENKPTFTDVLELNDKLKIMDDGGRITTSLDSQYDMLERIEPNCFAVSCWNSFRVLPMRTASCVYGTLNTTLDTIFSPELRKMISHKDKVDFEKLASSKTVLFVSTSAVNPSLNCFVNMFYAQMFKQLFEFAESRPDGKLPVPVSVLADDFAVGSRIQNFPEYISVFREKNLSTVILLQSESQLERMYGCDDAINIIDNCDTYVYMGGMNLKTCRNISERLDVPLDEVLYMPKDQVIIFRRGQRPVISKRFDILNNKMYQRITKEYEKLIREAEKCERR